MKGERRKK